MVKDADVFLTNYRPGSLLKLKMDYDSIAAINPKIIYGIVTAYGTIGPDKDMPGYDFAAGWARSGIQYMLTVPGSLPPTSRPGIIDRVSSMQIFGGIAAALYNRERTGEGQKVEFNLYHTGVWMVGADIMDALVGVPLRIVDPAKSDNPFYDVYKTKDDRWLQLTAGDRYAAASDPTGAAFWAGSPTPSTGPTWPTTRASRPPTAAGAPRRSSSPCWKTRSPSRTYAEWEVRLRANDLMYGPILSPRAGPRRPAGAGQQLLRRDRPARRRQAPHSSTSPSVRAGSGVDPVDPPGARRAHRRGPGRAWATPRADR